MKFLLSLSLKVKIIIAACAAAAAAVTAAVIIINSEDAYRVIKVFEVDGKAVVTRENTGELEAYAGMNLESGDVLSVGSGSVMRISLDDDKYILLDGGTVLELIAQGSASDSKTIINLQKGTILNEIKNPLSANSSYEVNTPKATMAVRGTIFSVSVEETDGGSFITDVCTSEGKVSVQLFDEYGSNKGEEIFVSAGNKVTILTEANKKTGNDPAIDGDPHFVFKNNDGSFSDCGNEDPVYPTDNNMSAEMQTEQTNVSVLSETVNSETSIEPSETNLNTETNVTQAALYVSDLPVSDIPAVTKAPTEIVKPDPVIPSEISSVSETTSEVKTSETTVAAVSEKSTVRSESSSSTGKTSSPQTSASSSAISQTATRLPVQTYPPTITSATAITGETMPSVSSSQSETDLPPDTETESTPSASGETSVSESTETDVTTSEETVKYTVSFIDENGNIISSGEFEDSDILGVLPAISDKKGYTGKWFCGGNEVTENTIISENMQIAAEYTPRPVTVMVYAPHSNDPLNTYDVVREFTVLYDDKLTDNAEGLTLESLTEYVESLYAEYFEVYGKVSELSFISFDGGVGEDLVYDSSVIAGDYVFDDGEKLCIKISFNYVSL